MNNKEFIVHLSKELNLDQKTVQDYSESLVNLFKEEWQEGNTIAIQGFGSFYVKKQLERIIINPATKQRMLVPPKLSLNFKPSTVLKDKLK